MSTNKRNTPTSGDACGVQAAPAPDRCPHGIRHPHPCRECEDDLPPEHLRMADALDEIAKPLAQGSASIVRRAAEMLRRTDGVSVPGQQTFSKQTPTGGKATPGGTDDGR